MTTALFESAVHVGIAVHRSEITSHSYTMGCPLVHGDNPQALASGLSYVQVDKHDISILPPTSV